MNIDEELDQGEIKRWNTDKGHLTIKEEYCKGCGYCIEFCPKDVLEEAEWFNEKGYHPPTPISIDSCINCGFCQLICPDFAIWVKEDEIE